MANLKVYNGSSWVSARPRIYTGSVWEDMGYFYNDNSQWERLFPTFTNIQISANDSDLNRINPNGIAYANIQFNANGIEYTNSISGIDNISTSRGTWLDSGNADEVWISCTVNTGSLYQNDASGGRVRCDNSPTFKVRDTTLDYIAVTANVTFNFYDASSGGTLLDSVTNTLSASYDDR